jgi:hypothetical protein
MKRNRLFLGLAALLVVAIGFGVWEVRAASLRATLASNWGGSFRATTDVGSATFDLGSGGNFSNDLTEGTGANQANKIFNDTATATTTYDLDGTLTGPLGTLTFTRIVAIRITTPATNTAAVTVSGDFIRSKYLSGWVADPIVIPVGGASVKGQFQFVTPSTAGVAITATSGDDVTVTVAGSDSFTIVVIGS